MHKILLFSILMIMTSCQKDEESYNPYLSSKDTSEPKVNNIYSYNNKKYKENDFPKSIKFAKYRASMKSYVELSNSIQEFYVRVDYMKERQMSDFYGRKGIVPSLSEIFKEDFNDEGVKAYYKKNKTLLSDIFPKEDKYWFDKVRYKYKVEYITQKFLDRLKELRDSKKLQVNVLPPSIYDVGIDFDKFPRIGKKKAKFELIAVTNYFCEDCRIINKEITQLFKEFGKDLSYIHVGHTYNLGDVSADTILAGRCVTEQEKNKYWKFHKFMFDNEEYRDIKIFDKKRMKSVLASVVKEISLDKKTFYECMSNKENIYNVSDSILFFRDLNVKQIPSFYLNGRLISYQEVGSLIIAFREMKDRLKRLGK